MRLNPLSVVTLVIISIIVGFLSNSALAEIRPLGGDGQINHSELSTAQIAVWKKWQAVLPSSVNLYYPNKLLRLYANRSMRPFWQDQNIARLFEKQLADIALANVQPQFVHWAIWLADPKLQGIARDMVLSDAFVGYLGFVENIKQYGRSWLYGPIPSDLPAAGEDMLAVWQSAHQTGEMMQLIDMLVPHNSQYDKMRAELHKLLMNKRLISRSNLVIKGTIKPGNVSKDTPVLRNILNHEGLLDTDTSYVEKKLPLVTAFRKGGVKDDSSDAIALEQQIDNEEPSVIGKSDTIEDHVDPHKYTPELVDAVKRYQEWYGLQADGVVGNLTRQWLNTSPDTLVSLLALNLQRLRLLPETIENGIMVNIPDYSLVYYKNGKVELESRVIVGSTRRKTPLMDSRINYIVINPPWNVPNKLAREDILPKLKANPNYLSSLNYVLYSDWGKDAEQIDPHMVDWSTVSASNFSYRIQQQPGANNALGFYKFNIPNSDAIYLHDTPNHGLFAKEIRSLSSGCVRVNKASELAKMLLNDAGWNDARIAHALQEGNTTYVNIRQDIPVELYYLTAWIGENGLPQYRTDIYNYDRITRLGSQVLHAAQILVQ